MRNERTRLHLLNSHDPRDEKIEPRIGPVEEQELKTLLSCWTAPPDAPLSLDTRLIASYRLAMPRPSLWRRIFAVSVPVPAPIAGLAVMALVALSLAVVMLSSTASHEESVITTQTQQAAPLEPIKVYVPQEQRVVTRIVYVKKREREAVRETQRQRATVAESEASSPSHQTEEAAGYFTRVDMAEFQPATEMKIKLIKRSSEDEK